jgi:hypothetical protein
VLAGFKDQMAALGYVEGNNVTYIYHGLLENDPEVIGGEVKRLLGASAATPPHMWKERGQPARFLLSSRADRGSS